MRKRVLVLLAPGAEEMETVITVDVLRRAGLEVTLAGVEGAGVVTCSREVRLTPDCALDQAQGPFDAIALPGGARGAEILAGSPQVQALLREQDAKGGFIAAICAAPIALVSANVGRGRKLTSHPAVKNRVASFGQYQEARVVQDGHFITSRGPGTAFEFALKLVELLAGAEAARKVAAPLLLPEGVLRRE